MSSNDDDLTPKDNKEYKTKEYWDQRYQKDKGLYDWFKGYGEIKHLINKYVPKDKSVLNVGCGNSGFSESMYQDDYKRITNIDFSEVVIDDMKQKYQGLVGLEWQVMDALDMTFESNSFDVVIEKGTIDALMCDQVSAWEVPDDIANSVDKMCSEIYRVLKPNGIFISITFAQPHFRKKLIQKEKFQWDLTMDTIGDFFHYFVYVLTKRPN